MLFFVVRVGVVCAVALYCCLCCVLLLLLWFGFRYLLFDSFGVVCCVIVECDLFGRVLQTCCSLCLMLVVAFGLYLLLVCVVCCCC